MATAAVDYAAWWRRALELAESRHLTYTARLVGTGKVGDEVFTVPSGDRRRQHWVRTLPFGARVRCDCPAGAAHKPCSHAGAVLHFLAARHRATNREWLAQLSEAELASEAYEQRRGR